MSTAAAEPVPVDQVGLTIADVRARRGISLANVSAAAGEAGFDLSTSAIHRIEKGERTPAADSLAALAAALGVTFNIGPKGISVIEKRRRAI